jgi:hypothetical protein
LYLSELEAHPKSPKASELAQLAFYGLYTSLKLYPDNHFVTQDILRFAEVIGDWDTGITVVKRLIGSHPEHPALEYAAAQLYLRKWKETGRSDATMLAQAQGHVDTLIAGAWSASPMTCELSAGIQAAHQNNDAAVRLVQLGLAAWGRHTPWMSYYKSLLDTLSQINTPEAAAEYNHVLAQGRAIYGQAIP